MLELMVVLVILSLIGVVVTVQVVQQLDRAKVDVARLQLRQIENAMQIFYIDVRRYPTADEGLRALVVAPGGAQGWRGPYLKGADLLQDPWGTAIAYEGDESGYSLRSMGTDRKPDGEGAASDITLTGGR